MLNNITIATVIFFSLIFSVFIPIKALAFTIEESSGSAITRSPYYDSTTDRYYVEFNGDVVVKIVYGSYDSTYTVAGTVKEAYADPKFVGTHRFTCNTYYKAEYFDANNNRVGLVKFHATEIIDPPCDSEVVGGGSATNPDCAWCNCPGWEQHMSKLDEIINKIPPTPDWNSVAGTFRDSIVPKLVSDIDNMLGRAPTLPIQPTDLPAIETNWFGSKTPQLETVPNLSESGFDKNKIETEAPVIQFREDESGGFKIENPIDSLPIFPTDDLPIPGQTSAGEWEQHKPIEQDNPFPVPTGGETTIPSEVAPIPTPNSDPAPTPDGNNGTAPIPSQDATAPNTGSGYKTHPDNPDGL